MLGHLVHTEGRGALVIGLPCIVAFVLFTFGDIYGFGDTYIGALSCLISGLWLLYIKQRNLIKRERDPLYTVKHSLLWIDIRYWAWVLLAIGLSWLITIARQ